MANLINIYNPSTKSIDNIFNVIPSIGDIALTSGIKYNTYTNTAANHVYTGVANKKWFLNKISVVLRTTALAADRALTVSDGATVIYQDSFSSTFAVGSEIKIDFRIPIAITMGATLTIHLDAHGTAGGQFLFNTVAFQR